MVLIIFIEFYEVIPGCIKMFSAPTLNWKYESASVKYWVSGGIIAEIVDPKLSQSFGAVAMTEKSKQHSAVVMTHLFPTMVPVQTPSIFLTV